MNKFRSVVLVVIAVTVAIVGVRVIFHSLAGNILGDVNGDGAVNVLDLSILANNYGKNGQTQAQGDINGDGLVNSLDLSILAINWGNLAPPVAHPGPVAITPPTGAIILTPTSDAPTIVSQAPVNSTFVFAPGLYRNLSLTPLSGDRFIGEVGAVLNGSKVLSGWSQSGTAWSVGGQTQTFWGAAGTCDTTHPMCGQPPDVYRDGVPLQAVANAAAVRPGTWFFDTVNHQILVGDNPNGHLLETSVAQTAFGGSATNVTVTNFVITEYATPPQYGVIDSVDGNGWTISHNDINLCHGGGIYAGSNTTATANYVHDNGQIGVKGTGTGVVFRGNEIAANNWAGFDPFWEAGGTKFWNATGLVFDTNNVHDNHGFGAWSDYSGAGTVYSNNTFTNNDLAGISHEGSYSAQIMGNTFTGNGKTTVPGSGDHTGGAVYVYDGSNVEVSNNIISGNDGGVVALCQNRGNGQLGTPLGCQNLSVHNNVMTLTAGFNGVFASAYTDFPPYAEQTAAYVEAFFTSDNIKWDNNTYHGTGFGNGALTDATLRFIWADPEGGDPTVVWSWATRRYFGFLDWQAHGQDVHSTYN